MAFADLFGSKLLTKDGTEGSTGDLLSGKTAIGIYFSAHWCPPCRGFTPKLAEFYTKSLKDKGLEIVFVSSDRDEGAFKEYYGEMPWLSVPYANREVKSKLDKKFKVQGIPSFVIVDAEGKTITTEGRSAVMEDPTGEDFPWKPKSMAEIFEGLELQTKSGKVPVKDAFSGKKAIGLYFSAHWCPPCRGFTPNLKEWYEKDLKANGLEIVFVSSDRDQAAFDEYNGEQPWLALEWSDRATKNALSKACKVEGIPSFVIIDPTTFKIINAEGREAVTKDPAGANLPWLPEPLKDLADGPSYINELPTVMVFCDEASDAEKAAVVAAMTPLAKKYVDAAGEDDPEFGFMVSKSGGELAGKVRGLTGLAETKATTMILIDIPSGGAYFVASAGEVNAASIEQFISDFKGGKLERKQLG